jgi:hypothetical protein
MILLWILIFAFTLALIVEISIRRFFGLKAPPF